MIVFDGHEYENAADVPDIGSFRCDTVELLLSIMV